MCDCTQQVKQVCATTVHEKMWCAVGVSVYSKTWKIARIRIARGEKFGKEDILVADMEELETLDTSENPCSETQCQTK